MEQQPLSSSDLALVSAAVAAVRKSVRQPHGESAPALVGAAVRLDDGSVLTSVNLIADVGSLSVCAEPIAIAEANRFPNRTIEAIVAVYHMPGQEPKVVPPCGKCREIMTDYASASCVILREPGTDRLFKVKTVDLLPLKYASFWRSGDLI